MPRRFAPRNDIRQVCTRPPTRTMYYIFPQKHPYTRRSVSAFCGCKDVLPSKPVTVYGLPKYCLCVRYPKTQGMIRRAPTSFSV